MGVYQKIVLNDDDTNEALGVAGREARFGVPGYGGTTERGVVGVRPVAPGYGGAGKYRVEGRLTVPGYGTVPITVRVVRFPNY